MRDWYAETFDAVPGVRGAFQTANLPGVDLSYAPSAEPLLGTQGRSFDHVGFEIGRAGGVLQGAGGARGHLRSPLYRNRRPGISLAFFTDPWGTYIELTEGLDQL